MLDNICEPFFISPKLKNESSEKEPLRLVTPIEVGEKRENMVSPPNTNTTNHYEKFLIPSPLPQSPSFEKYIHLPWEPRENHTTHPSKRFRGRTQGSNNKCKSPIKIDEDPGNIMKLIFIKIPVGHDVVDSLINVALHHQANITVLGGSGLVSDVTLHNSVSQAPAFTIYGSFQMISITGTYFISNYGSNPSEDIIEPIYSSFSLFLTCGYGEVFGGIIVGKVKAADDILITVALSKKHEFYRVPTINGSVREVEEDDLKGLDGVIVNVDHVEAEPKNTHIISNYDVTGASSTHLNHQFLALPSSNDNVIQWNHHSHTNSY